MITFERLKGKPFLIIIYDQSYLNFSNYYGFLHLVFKSLASICRPLPPVNENNLGSGFSYFVKVPWHILLLKVSRTPIDKGMTNRFFKEY